MKWSIVDNSTGVPGRGPTTRTAVAGVLAAAAIFPGIVGCSGQATASPVASSSAISTAIGTIVTGPSDISMPAIDQSPQSELVAAPTLSESSAGVTTLSDPPASAVSALGALPVRDPAPEMGYTRAQFGQAWSDDVTVEDGHNGCDTRNDILRRDLTAVQIKPGTNGCVVLTGRLDDPYSTQIIPFVRGSATSDAIQIDHVVALADAWRSGAQLLTADQRQNLANDPLNLLAVSGSLNQAKGDGDAASWLPPSGAFRCAYVTRQIEVKTRYSLWVAPAEHDAMARVLSSCSASLNESPAATDSDPPTPVAAATAPAPTPQPASTTQTSSGEAYFKNCAAARAAGAAPLYRGQPGYRDSMDGDQDGIACEK